MQNMWPASLVTRGILDKSCDKSATFQVGFQEFRVLMALHQMKLLNIEPACRLLSGSIWCFLRSCFKSFLSTVFFTCQALNGCHYLPTFSTPMIFQWDLRHFGSAFLGLTIRSPDERTYASSQWDTPFSSPWSSCAAPDRPA